MVAVVEDSCLFTAKDAKGREGGGDFPRRRTAGEKAPLAWRRWVRPMLIFLFLGAP